MRWTERQLAMLREMGIRVWLREGAADLGEATAVLDRGAAAVDERVADAAVAVAADPEARARLAEVPGVAESPAPFAASTGAPAKAQTIAQATAATGNGLVPDAADWLVVGEPLGAGPAELGQLLDNLLRAVRVSRQAGPRDRRAAWLELGAAAPVDLDAAIAAVAPRVVLALGRAAAQALLGLDEPLGRLREREHARAGVPVVVSFDLAYLLRHPAEKAKAWADLCRAAAVIA